MSYGWGDGMSIKTTHVGSWPRTQALQEARQKLLDTADHEEFDRVLDEQVRFIIDVQLQTGVDEINDGEYRRSIYFGDISGLPGFQQDVFPIEFSAGDAYRTPVVTGKIEYDRSNPFAPLEVKQVKAILAELGVEKRIKVTLPSLSHMSAFYPDPSGASIPAEAVPLLEQLHEQAATAYPTIQDYLDDVKEILLNEARGAIDAGVDSIQFDSPDLLAFTSPAMSLDVLKGVTRQRIELNNLVLSELPADMLEIHACWGNYISTQITTQGSISSLLPELYELKVGTLGPLEVFDGMRDFAELEALRAYPVPEDKKLALGIVSVKTRNVEPVPVLIQRYEAAKQVIDEDRLVVSPGCGFASEATTVVSLESAKRKMTNLVKAVQPEEG